jgi:hypothetical protein
VTVTTVAPVVAAPAILATPAAATSAPSPHDGIPLAAPAIAVVAAFGAALGLFQIARRRQLAVATAQGAE